MPKRRFTQAEFAVYFTAWIVAIALVTVADRSPFASVCLVAMPGILIGGPIGLACGGRAWFWPASLILTAIWIVALVIPAMNAAR